jgi:hypothetical protein
MVSWKRSFRGALVYVVFSIIWVIVGAAIIIGGILAGGFTSGPFGIPQPNLGVIIVAAILGYIIIALGSTAVWLKITAEITAEEVEKRVKPSGS